MSQLENKLKRWKFLNELYNRGVESVSSQIERVGGEIMLMRIEIELDKKRKERDSKINSIIK
jgi:hypothetical protein